MAYVWQIAMVQFGKKFSISGFILSGNPPSSSEKPSKNFKKIFGSYLKKPLTNKEIVISSGNVQIESKTDDRGGFSIETDYTIEEDLQISEKGKNNPLTFVQTYSYFFADSSHSLAVISDIDDTLLVSHTASLWKRVNTILFVSAEKRKPVSFTLKILETVASKSGRIFFVSKSESNLFALLTSFMLKRNIPKGILYLTPYLKLKQLLKPKKGKDYKEKIIRSIIDESPGKKFILIGDDTQLDMAVYSKIANSYPELIVKIYIRKTMKNLLGIKKNYLNKLRENEVPFLYFSDENDVSDELKMIENYQNKEL